MVAPTIVPRLVHCGGYSLSAGREAPPYGLCLFCCLAMGNAFRRDARPRPTGLCLYNAVMLRFTDSNNYSSFIIFHAPPYGCASVVLLYRARIFRFLWVMEN